MRPTPSQWWAGLDLQDRLAFIAAVEDDLDIELVFKLEKAQIEITAPWTTPGGWSTLFPRPYWEYAAAQAIWYDDEPNHGQVA